MAVLCKHCNDPEVLNRIYRPLTIWSFQGRLYEVYSVRCEFISLAKMSEKRHKNEWMKAGKKLKINVERKYWYHYIKPHNRHVTLIPKATTVVRFCLEISNTDFHFGAHHDRGMEERLLSNETCVLLFNILGIVELRRREASKRQFFARSRFCSGGWYAC